MPNNKYSLYRHLSLLRVPAIDIHIHENKWIKIIQLINRNRDIEKIESSVKRKSLIRAGLGISRRVWAVGKTNETAILKYEKS